MSWNTQTSSGGWKFPAPSEAFLDKLVEAIEEKDFIYSVTKQVKSNEDGHTVYFAAAEFFVGEANQKNFMTIIELYNTID